MPGSIQFFDAESADPIAVIDLPDGQAAVAADVPAGAVRSVVVSQLPPVPVAAPEPEETADFDLAVSVRVYGGGTAWDAATALTSGRGTFDLAGDGEVEILTARPYEGSALEQEEAAARRGQG